MKPFLKWAGNKYPLMERIKALLPPGKRLIEPFVGSAAVFLNTQYSEYCLADSNRDLINLFKILQQKTTDFIVDCKHYFAPIYNQETVYYELRDTFNTTADHYLKALLFIYLNKHCFNGLCRYNASHKFNVPYGRYRQPYFPEAELLYFIEKAQQAVFLQADFETTMLQAQTGDVVYCDPPYVPLSSTANFTAYSGQNFGEDQQVLLAELAERLVDKGVTVVISNHATEFTYTAYAKAQIIEFDVQRYISCKGQKREKAKELLAVFTSNSAQP